MLRDYGGESYLKFVLGLVYAVGLCSDDGDAAGGIWCRRWLYFIAWSSWRFRRCDKRPYMRGWSTTLWT